MDIKKSIQKQNDVSLMLTKHVFDNKSDANMVFSPLSIQIALALVAAGAKGPTSDQFLSFFNLDSIDELNSLSSRLVSDVLVDGSSMGGPRLSVASSVWVEKSRPLKPSFKQVMDNVYKAACKSVDFQNKGIEVSNEVNQWAQEETNGLIKDILPPDAVHESTRLILANALYFKGAWKAKFNASYTQDHEFHLLNGKSNQAPFMSIKAPPKSVIPSPLAPSPPFTRGTQEKSPYEQSHLAQSPYAQSNYAQAPLTTNTHERSPAYRRSSPYEQSPPYKRSSPYERSSFMTDEQYIEAYNGFRVLRLPYEYGTDKRHFSMYFFLPDALDGLPTLVDKVCSEPGFLDRHKPSKNVKVGKFLIPKFKITFDFEASKVLKGLGLTLPFLGGGLTEMVEDEPLFVDKVFHKSFIEVNEEGTEAAAVTAITMRYRCPMMPIEEEKIDFVADHPFLFIVRDDATGVVLFTGTVLNPLAD